MPKSLKIALVHDYLNQYGGGERVLEVLMEMFPDAPVYTLFYDEQRTLNRFRGRIAKTSFLNHPVVHAKHRWFIPLMPFAANSIDLGSEYDLIISDTAGYAKGIKYDKNRTKHISYIHTPLRYAWEQEHYLRNVISNFQFRISKPILDYLKNWDFKAGQKPDVLIANSNFIADKIREYYKRDSKVIYPPVDTEKFFYERRGRQQSKYYLAVGRIIHYKRFDLVADAFIKLRLPLKIVGSGPDYQKLQQKIKNYGADNIELIPFLNDEQELRKLYANAEALIFPQVEDFGLVAAEAQACGTPVIAYARGGALEIVRDKISGVFFHRQSPLDLMEAINSLKRLKFSRKKISNLAQRFSKENFKKQLSQTIQI